MEEDERFLQLAVHIRTICSSFNVVQGNISAVIAKDGKVLSWGHVRSLLAIARRSPAEGKDKLPTDLHAEADAITCAGMNGIPLAGSTLYCTSIPCPDCFTLIAGSGITRIVYPPAPRTDFYGPSLEHQQKLAHVYGIDVCNTAVLPRYSPLPVSVTDLVDKADGDAEVLRTLLEDLVVGIGLPWLQRRMRMFDLSLGSRTELATLTALEAGVDSLYPLD